MRSVLKSGSKSDLASKNAHHFFLKQMFTHIQSLLNYTYTIYTIHVIYACHTYNTFNTKCILISSINLDMLLYSLERINNSLKIIICFLISCCFNAQHILNIISLLHRKIQYQPANKYFT